MGTPHISYYDVRLSSTPSKPLRELFAVLYVRCSFTSYRRKKSLPDYLSRVTGRLLLMVGNSNSAHHCVCVQNFCAEIRCRCRQRRLVERQNLLVCTSSRWQNVSSVVCIFDFSFRNFSLYYYVVQPCPDFQDSVN